MKAKKTIDDSAKAEELPPVVYRYGDEDIDLVQSGLRRPLRRLLTSEGERIRRKHGHLKHPETGERPTVVIHVSKDRLPKVTARLVTDSEVLRGWLKEQGIVIEEIVQAPNGESSGDVVDAASAA